MGSHEVWVGQVFAGSVGFASLRAWLAQFTLFEGLEMTCDRMTFQLR